MVGPRVTGRIARAGAIHTLPRATGPAQKRREAMANFPFSMRQVRTGTRVALFPCMRPIAILTLVLGCTLCTLPALAEPALENPTRAERNDPSMLQYGFAGFG